MTEVGKETYVYYNFPHSKCMNMSGQNKCIS